MGTNICYIVTNFKHNNSRFLYQELYCGRGQMELYIKELKIIIEFPENHPYRELLEKAFMKFVHRREAA